jgi:ABC-2 type transport system permease protein
MLELFKFECRYQLRSPLFWVLALTFFLFAFFMMASDNITLGGVGNSTNYNAAWTIVYTQFFFSLIGMLAAIAIVAQAITRDYELRTAELFFATGVTPRAYLLGRFSGACLFGVLVGVMALLGTLLGTLMPWLDSERVGAFDVAPYVYAFGVVIVPNLFATSALFFTLAALGRSMLFAFSGAVAFLVLNVLVGSLVDAEKIELLAVIDPFGRTAFEDVSRYWTVFERNTQLVPVSGNLLINRLLWVSIGVVALLVTTWRFQFILSANTLRRIKAVRSTASSAPIPGDFVAAQRFGLSTAWRQLASQIRIDLSGIYKSVPFYAILGFACLNVWGGFAGATEVYGTPLLPVTSNLLAVINNSYAFFVLLIAMYYAGEIVHRERERGVSEVVDALPFASFVMVASKIVTLWFIIVCLLLFGMATALLTQMLNGYTHFELGVYLQWLFLVQGGPFFLLAVLAVFIQVLAGNKWVGMVLLLVVLIGLQALPNWGFQHSLYLFELPTATYSDMNGFGDLWQSWRAYALYWSAFSVLLVLAAHLFLTRGQSEGLPDRWVLATNRLTPPTVLTGVGAMMVFVAGGGWIFYNTNVLNEYLTTEEFATRQANYEKLYKKYELVPQPGVVAIDSKVDLYPQERRLESQGQATLVNQHAHPIETLLVTTHPFISINNLALGQSSLVTHEADYGTHLFRFDPPLGTGDRVKLNWDLTWQHIGFTNPAGASLSGADSTRVVGNGTFVNNSEIMPMLGYNRGIELVDPGTRREHGLAPIVRLPKLGDPNWINVSQFGVAQRSEFRTEFSTSADQIAIAPGYLVGEVAERNGRKYFTYAMDEPIWPFFAFVSARYEVARRHHKGVDIEVYHHGDHSFNVEPMLRSTQKSLDYFNQAFAPYQYRQFRILEFPRYARFAQSFPNTVPFSEAIGFVADLRDPEVLDQVFYVTAHELAHQWWGHQVAGAMMQGMTVIVESLAQYSALMVMEQEYGPDKMRRFLRYELDRYLSGRGGELIEELPLMLSENQPYIHYQKGSLVMYALQNMIGESKVNLALRNFLDKFAYGDPPFPTAKNLVDEFRAVSEPQHQRFITDLFEKITLYDFSITSAEVVPVENVWEVRITLHAQKYYADGKGEQTPADLDLMVDIGVFPEDEPDAEDNELPAPLFFERRRLGTGTQQIILRLSKQPYRVGVDPYHKLIDRNPGDNLRRVSEVQQAFDTIPTTR